VNFANEVPHPMSQLGGNISLQFGSWRRPSLQEIPAFFTKNFGPKNPPYGFFAPMFNLTKVPFWTSQFGVDHFDQVFLVGIFDWVFFTKPP
jgi:hypothetical protein